LGGLVMARMNAACGARVVELLEVRPTDRVLEVGYGSGVVVQHLSQLVSAGHVAGIDASQVMVKQARARNATGIRNGRVELRCGLVEALPFGDECFDKALAINSLQLWPNAIAGLCEMRRVMKSGGRIGLGFTPYAGQPKEALAARLIAAGFADARTVEKDRLFCALATKP
jgi:ubiquinone/menaquinone biosynthesis C-methylase UbiE